MPRDVGGVAAVRAWAEMGCGCGVVSRDVSAGADGAGVEVGMDGNERTER